MTALESGARRSRRNQRGLENVPGLPALSYTSMCKFHLRKKCSRGDQCTFAHDESQLRGKPDLAGTKLCRFYAAGQPCRYGSKCTHSHGPFDSGYGSQGSQTSDELEEGSTPSPHYSPRYVHIPELMTMKRDKVGQDFPIEAPTERAQLLAALELLQTWVNQNGNNDQGTSEKMPMRRLSDGPSRTKFCSVWF